ncbi:MAG: phenylacetate--CoA ligase family protein [Vicinamibacterales bacterium]
MSETALKLYHRLPPPVRSLAASARGLYLRTSRYGASSERIAAEALARDRWPAARLEAYQQERLAFVLHRAATRVPYYRAQWEERRRRGDRAPVDVLANWPVLEKDVVRRQPHAFVADDCNPRRMFTDHTSGSTGKPLTLWLSRETLRTWYALAEARWRSWYGVSRRDRWAILGGQLVTPVGATTPPFWVWNLPLRQLYMSSYHLSARTTPDYLDALRRYRIRYLFGYTSSLHALAREAQRLGLPGGHMAVAITNAEPLYDHQRQSIAAVFGCPVRETYGMAEAVAALSECEHGRLHLWPEAGLVELLDQDGDAAPDRPGDLVATGLLNADMPLIRYRTGDRATRGDATPCPCGRTLPRLAGIDGRIDDSVITRDGRRVGRLDPVFKDDLPLREAQIIQEQLDAFRILCVPEPGYSPDVERVLAERLRDRVGDVQVSVERVSEIARGASGKFRAVICRLPADAHVPQTVAGGGR